MGEIKDVAIDQVLQSGKNYVAYLNIYEGKYSTNSSIMV